MEFPHGHHHHHHHQSRDDEAYPPPSQPYPPLNYETYPPPPPHTTVTHVHHSTSYPEPEAGGPGSYYPPPPPPAVDFAYAPPSPPAVDYGYSGPPNPGGYSSVEHVSHQTHRPHFPSFIHHHTHNSSSEIGNNRSVRVYTKAEPNFSLTIRDGNVILARSNPADPFQHWIKDERYSTKVKDEEGLPSFALVNKATGQALKHSIGATYPVQLVPYNPDILDEAILWTDKDLGDSYRAIRMVNNIRLNVDAFNGDQNHGGVHDGTTIVLWEWKKGDNQRWKIVPY